MKKLCILATLVVLCNASVAQDVELFKGYAGLKIGPAFPLGKDVKEVCNVGLLFDFNFGYLFSTNVGLNALLFGTAFPAKHGGGTIGLSGLMAGPLFVLTSEPGKIQFDIKPALGFGNGTVMSGWGTSTSGTTFIAGLGASIRWHCWRRVSLSVNADYFYGNPESVNLSSLSGTVGVHYRFN